ncbi:hypothetical protein B9C57_03075 [Tenacibaculum maritimum]|nr:hypothetical protein B9C57_03075 [Tenacibaculum maritimum]
MPKFTQKLIAENVASNYATYSNLKLKFMKKTLLVLTICLISNLTFGQKTEKINGDTKFSCSQKYGLTETKNDYVLNVFYDSENLKFSTAEKQRMTSYSVAKKTEKYVIGKNSEGNYSFYDIKKRQFYYIDYYKRYMTAGYGSGSTEIKQSVLKMMDMLKKGKSQKDVIQYLIEQTKYDF